MICFCFSWKQIYSGQNINKHKHSNMYILILEKPVKPINKLKFYIKNSVKLSKKEGSKSR